MNMSVKEYYAFLMKQMLEGDITVEEAKVAYTAFRTLQQEKLRTEDVENKVTRPSQPINKIVYPHEVYEALDKDVVNQVEAKKGLATAIATYLTMVNRTYKEYNELQAPRIGILGPTGSGKTFMLQSLAKYADLDLVFINCGEYMASGWHGKNLLDIFESNNTRSTKQPLIVEHIINKANQLLRTDKESTLEEIYKKAVSKVVIVFDEFDKIANKAGTEGNAAAASKDLMTDYMSILSGRDVHIEDTYNEYKGTFNTTQMPIVCLGAFVGLDDIENEKTPIGIGFGSTHQESEHRTLKSNLHKFGFMPELLGRLTTLIKVTRLNKEELKRVLELNVLRPFTLQFDAFGVAVRYSEEFKDGIAEQAFKADEGARALTEHVELQLRNHIFKIHEYKNSCITITKCGKMEAEIIDDQAHKRGVAC